VLHRGSIIPEVIGSEFSTLAGYIETEWIIFDITGKSKHRKIKIRLTNSTGQSP
jgi:hypothetical protein